MAISPELKRELLTLPADERQELADELYESLAPDQVWEREWSPEIERRANDVVTGSADLIEADVVHRELLEELSSR